jgi:hypothetical protein
MATWGILSCDYLDPPIVNYVLEILNVCLWLQKLWLDLMQSET